MAVNALEAAGIFLLDVIFPRRCCGCGVRGTWLCDRCESELGRFAGQLCPRCGIPLELNICQCDELPPAIERVRSVGPYAGWLRGAVSQVKYHGEWARVGHVSPMLACACSDLVTADALVPVPLHPSRRRQRGFNQTEKIAEAVSLEIAVPVQHALRRCRRTSPQVRLDGEGRRANVLDAFALSPGYAVNGARLILVDDVITTGATLGACAQVLLAAGAHSVDAVTIAREL